MRLIIDPRNGDIEDDASSTKRHSLLELAGSLLVEISFAKLFAAWLVLVVLPGIFLGLAPLVASAWLSIVVDKAAALAGIGSAVLLCLVLAVGWFGFRHLFRIVERSFWSLNALLVQPIYALARETIRHVAEHFLKQGANDAGRERIRSAGAAIAGIIVFVAAALVAAYAWQFTRWTASMADLAAPLSLLPPAFANMAVLVVGYLGGGSLFWGLADANTEQPRSLKSFDAVEDASPRWRIAHISDIHLVGERHGFRIECGRAGPSGNERFDAVLNRLEIAHQAQPLDYILITGDLTDAGRSSEWAEFLGAVERHPTLLERMLVIPGNHDINVVDRANPARFELPISPGKRLRQLRALSALSGIQGDRVRTVDPGSHEIGSTLADALKAHQADIQAFADAGGLRLSWRLESVWSDVFPLVVPPATDTGLGIVLLNSNAEANFSFTNALGLVPFEDAKALLSVIQARPRAHWIIALHHHLVEYPMPAEQFSERIGTALINGNWLVRELKPHAKRIAVLHGHRHIDWIGACGALRVISAPSPVMPTKGESPAVFYVHTFAAAAGGLALVSSSPIVVADDIDDGAND
jgi:3',5'-cyclic AMP phosphodiesterase CpdA